MFSTQGAFVHDMEIESRNIFALMPMGALRGFGKGILVMQTLHFFIQSKVTINPKVRDWNEDSTLPQKDCSGIYKIPVHGRA